MCVKKMGFNKKTKVKNGIRCMEGCMQGVKAENKIKID